MLIKVVEVVGQKKLRSGQCRGDALVGMRPGVEAEAEADPVGDCREDRRRFSLGKLRLLLWSRFWFRLGFGFSFWLWCRFQWLRLWSGFRFWL